MWKRIQMLFVKWWLGHQSNSCMKIAYKIAVMGQDNPADAQKLLNKAKDDLYNAAIEFDRERASLDE